MNFFLIYFIILIHIFGIFAIIYYICNYFYLNQLYRNESCFFGFLFEYWETERKIEKLEKNINLNLAQLITSKGYSHEENINNQKK